MIPVVVALLIALGAFYGGVALMALLVAAGRRDHNKEKPHG